MSSQLTRRPMKCLCLAAGDPTTCVCRPAPEGCIQKWATNPATGTIFDDPVPDDLEWNAGDPECGCEMGMRSRSLEPGQHVRWFPRVLRRHCPGCRDSAIATVKFRTGPHEDTKRILVNSWVKNKRGLLPSSDAFRLMLGMCVHTKYSDEWFLEVVERLGAWDYDVGGAVAAVLDGHLESCEATLKKRPGVVRRRWWRLWCVDEYASDDLVALKERDKRNDGKVIRMILSWCEMTAFTDGIAIRSRTRGRGRPTAVRKFLVRDGDHAVASRVLRFLSAY